MTEQQFLEQVETLLTRAKAGMKANIAAAIKVGAIELEGEPSDSYRLAKAALCAALRAEVGQWRPLGGETAEERNLRHYI